MQCNTIQYNISSAAPTRTADQALHSTFKVQFWSSAANKNVFSLRLNSGEERNCQSPIDSLFQARGAATEKALSPNLRIVRDTMKSPRLDDRTEDLPGTSTTRVNRSLRYLGERPSCILRISNHKVKSILRGTGNQCSS